MECYPSHGGISSGEAEFNADVKAGSILLGFRSLLQDLGVPPPCLNLYTDSSAAIGVANRTGIGKIRHLAVHLVWIQETVKPGELILHKIAGTRNHADVLTKHLTQDGLEKHLEALTLRFIKGRAKSAPQALL